MEIDGFGQVGLTEAEASEALKKYPSMDLEEIFLMQADKYLQAIDKTYILLPRVQKWEDRITPNDCNIEEFHQTLANIWKFPDKYQNYPIEEWLITQCKTKDEVERVRLELAEYSKRNLIPMLRYLRYLREIARINKITWGIGRGSSCCSYCLYLMGVHRVNSMQYKLDIGDFLR